MAPHNMRVHLHRITILRNVEMRINIFLSFDLRFDNKNDKNKNNKKNKLHPSTDSPVLHVDRCEKNMSVCVCVCSRPKMASERKWTH